MLRCTLALAIGALAALTAGAADPVPVKGSTAKYSPAVEVVVGDKAATLKLTGVGLRSKVGFSVYAVGSYLQEGVAVRTPEELAKADAVRMLHLVMERTVEAGEFIDAFKSSVGKSYPADKFKEEFAQIAKAVGNNAAKKGDQVLMIYSPDVGVRMQIMGRVDVTVKNPAFAQALWEIYLGAKPIDEGLKKGLVGMLGK